MKKEVIIDVNDNVQAYIISLPDDASEIFHVQKKVVDFVREEGCYMKDYEIDGMGVIIHTTMQHVVDSIN